MLRVTGGWVAVELTGVTDVTHGHVARIHVTLDAGADEGQTDSGTEGWEALQRASLLLEEAAAGGASRMSQDAFVEAANAAPAVSPCFVDPQTRKQRSRV